MVEKKEEEGLNQKKAFAQGIPSRSCSKDHTPKTHLNVPQLVKVKVSLLFQSL